MNATTWAVLLGFLGVLAAYVALALTGHDTSGLVNAVVTVLGVTGLAAHIEKRTQQQNERIAKIDHQTNGVLDKRIQDGTRAAVTAVLDERGIVSPKKRGTPTRTG